MLSVHMEKILMKYLWKLTSLEILGLFGNKIKKFKLNGNPKMTVPLNLKEYLTNKVDDYQDEMFEYV